MYDEVTGHLCSGLHKADVRGGGDLFDKVAAEREETKNHDVTNNVFGAVLPYCGEE
jgi:hypothetical protein